MNFRFQSLLTKSYWIYSLYSIDALKTFSAVFSTLWLFIDIFDSFDYVKKSNIPNYYLFVLFVIAILTVLISRRPVNKIKYKHTGLDITIEVRIGDLFNISGQKIISTNTSFDTDISNGIISPNSLQGQFTQKFFQGEVFKLDNIIDEGLKNSNYTIRNKPGKNKYYEIGTTVKIKIADQYFYWLAMADLNESNTASTNLGNIDKSLESLWEFIMEKGEKLDIVIPVLGSGLGRLTTNRKKLIALIAQSFITASDRKIFSNRLVIVIPSSDVDNSNINLFQLKDLLINFLP